jgi:hypothetical protein
MIELSYWLIAFGLIALMFWALFRENARLKRRTPEEYEADLANSKASLLRSGLVELDRFLGETKQKTAAVEYLKDEEQGQTKTGGKDDDQ